ncbi:MAG: riboflavin synthase, alpha subunit [Solirubrobacterales bacterium]|jgi:riboflavin synthase|nr:riboflavin synthase, alpha subunit [Solirubrobacterales bacterium]
MFTGIVAELGEVLAVEPSEAGARLRVRGGLSAELSPGDSIAVNGACLTATTSSADGFEADVMRQTLDLTTLGGLNAGDPVNLELPLRAEDRLGGHVVQGHVDARAAVAGVEADGFARRLRVELPEDLRSLVVERGSIAIDGVSLTVASLGSHWAEVSLIPETLERTTLGRREPGDLVNLECDVMARYVQRMLPSLSPLTTEGNDQ